jgi:hypothetical protein
VSLLSLLTNLKKKNRTSLQSKLVHRGFKLNSPTPPVADTNLPLRVRFTFFFLLWWQSGPLGLKRSHPSWRFLCERVFCQRPQKGVDKWAITQTPIFSFFYRCPWDFLQQWGSLSRWIFFSRRLCVSGSRCETNCGLIGRLERLLPFFSSKGHSLFFKEYFGGKKGGPFFFCSQNFFQRCVRERGVVRDQ